MGIQCTQMEILQNFLKQMKIFQKNPSLFCYFYNCQGPNGKDKTVINPGFMESKYLKINNICRQYSLMTGMSQ